MYLLPEGRQTKGYVDQRFAMGGAAEQLLYLR